MDGYRFLEGLGISPGAWNVWFFRSSFKIYEFSELTRESGLRARDHALDLGCGVGRQTQLLARCCQHVVGQDISEKSIATARRLLRFSPVRKRIEYICAPLEDIAWDGPMFDHVFSFCVLEHIQNLEVVLAKATQILKPGGMFHMSVDSLGTIQDERLRAKHKRDHHVVQYFTSDTLKTQLEQAGFQVITTYPIMTSAFARSEFERRIVKGHKYAFLKRIRVARRFQKEDEQERGPEGIMVIGHARCPDY